MAIARLNAPELTKGAWSIAFVKNPNDPIWAKDPGVGLYRTIMKRHLPREAERRLQLVRDDRRLDDGRDPEEGGQAPTRASLLRAASSLDTGGNPFLLPGIKLQTTRRSYFPLDRVYLYRYDNRQWVKASPLVDARGWRSPSRPFREHMT